jgi:hypothetical protein
MVARSWSSGPSNQGAAPSLCELTAVYAILILRRFPA